MSYRPTNYTILDYDAGAYYKKDDIVTYLDNYWYATQNTIGVAPTTSFTVRTASTLRRERNILTAAGFTSISPAPARGSYALLANAVYLDAAYTGVVIDGTSTSITYINPGPDINVSTSSSVALYNNRVWTTGFGWIPSYTTDLNGQMNILNGRVTDTYEQRQRYGINSNKAVVNMVFDNVTSREAVAIHNYIQDKGGVDPIRINLGDGYIGSNVAAWYKIEEPKISPKSYDVNTVTATATQVFDPL